MRVAARRHGDGVELEVAADGIGVPVEFLPYVFDRFRQRDSSTTRAADGFRLDDRR